MAEGALNGTTNRLDEDHERELVRAQVSKFSQVDPAKRNAHIRANRDHFRPGTWIHVLRQLDRDPTSEDAFIEGCWLAFLGLHPSVERNDGIERLVRRITKSAARAVGGDVQRQMDFVQDLRTKVLVPVTKQTPEPDTDKWVFSFFIKLNYALREMERRTRGDEISGGMSDVPKSLKRAKSRVAGSGAEDEKKDQKSMGDRNAGSDDETGLPRSDAEWDRMIARALQRQKEPKKPDRLEWVYEVEPHYLTDAKWNERSEKWEIREALLAAIQRLPPRERDAMELFARDVQVKRGTGDDAENVEDLMGISHTAFYSLKNSALQKLRNDPELRRAMVDEVAVRSQRPNPPEGTGAV